LIPRTRFLISSITLAVLLGGRAADGDDKGFQPQAASAYAHQSVQQVTVGAKAYATEELQEEAFGKKTKLLKFGVLPVLVVIENKRSESVDLHDLEVSLVAADGRHVTAVPPEELPYLAKNGKRKPSAAKVGLPVPLPQKKNPLGGDEIVARAFVARMLPPGDSASGFFYFEARAESGDSVYVNGMREARSRKEIMYFEFPLAGQGSGQ
jgi:hypothetical protein